MHISGTRRRRRHRNKLRRSWFFLIGILSMILVCLLVVAWNLPDGVPSTSPTIYTEPEPTEPEQTEPPRVLALPDGITLLTPVIPTSAEVSAGDFVSGLEGTGISVVFAAEPSSLPGMQTVTLVFTRDNVSCQRQTTCYRFLLIDTVTVDAAQGRVVNVRDFVADENVEVLLHNNTQPALNTPGEKDVTLLCDGKFHQVKYIVKESNPPEGTACEVTAEIGSVPDPTSLVSKITDESRVRVSYKEQPVLRIVGDYPVTLVLTDEFGNSSELSTTIHVVAAANAPQFEGLNTLRICVGDTVSYKSGVSAVDHQDGAVRFTVDADAVNLNKKGTYTVYYSATDSDGNTTIIPRTIIVEDVGQASTEKLARAVLDSIITEGMTRDQKIYAVYYYSRHNVQFVGTSNKESIWHGAYEGFTTGKGDCYTYYAMNTVLLDLLGIENLEVRRTGGTSNHWWNLVLHEDGMYYHVDSCPVAVVLETVNQARMTETDLQVYTSDEHVAARRPNFYVYDHTLPAYQDIPIAP